MDAVVRYTLAQQGNEQVRSVNAIVGETNDGGLNDIRGLHISRQHVLDAIGSASAGPVLEGSVGAGTGTINFGWKGGIGTSSRRLPPRLGGWTLGVLVQTNFGGVLSIGGVPVGRALGRDSYRPDSGSCIVIVATDAPLSDRNLKRIASRAMLGLGRTGSAESNGSGDYAVAFSTAPGVRRSSTTQNPVATSELSNNDVDALFQAVVETTEEAVYNSLLMATTVTSRGGTVEALPIARVRDLLERAGIRPR